MTSAPGREKVMHAWAGPCYGDPYLVVTICDELVEEDNISEKPNCKNCLKRKAAGPGGKR